MATPQPKTPYEEAGERRDPRSVSGQFGETESLEARAYRENDAANDSSYDESIAEEELVAQEQELEDAELERQLHARNQELLLRRLQSAQRTPHVGPSKGKFVAKRTLATFAKWFSLTIVFGSYLVQLVFALFSILFFSVDAVMHSTWWGDAVAKGLSWASTILSWFTSFEGYSAYELGMMFWSIATIIALMTFFAFFLWFNFVGVDFSKQSPVSTLVMATCFAGAILPFSNIFPWIVVWVIYVNVTSLFNDVRYLAKGT